MNEQTENFHVPVLSQEAVRFLINEDCGAGVIVDGTLGAGGYTKLICENTKDPVRVISIDKDLNALEYSKKRLREFENRIQFVNGNFGDLKEILSANGIKSITGLVMDLGLSSYQLEAEEGFSFMKDTELDMRADKEGELTASEILNSYAKEELKKIFEEYGEIGKADRLVNAIINKRKKEKFKTTFDLVETVKEEYDLNKKNQMDFLAKIFQSIRIEVNDELDNLKNVLKNSMDLFDKGGRIVVVSYHSLEDRIVKNFFKEEAMRIKKTADPFSDEERTPRLKILTKKPVVPEFEEIKSNPRSRSAKLRAAEVI